MGFNSEFKGLNPICHLLALLGAHHILHVSRIRVKRNCKIYGISLVLVLKFYSKRPSTSNALEN